MIQINDGLQLIFKTIKIQKWFSKISAILIFIAILQLVQVRSCGWEVCFPTAWFQVPSHRVTPWASVVPLNSYHLPGWMVPSWDGLQDNAFFLHCILFWGLVLWLDALLITDYFTDYYISTLEGCWHHNSSGNHVQNKDCLWSMSAWSQLICD